MNLTKKEKQSFRLANEKDKKATVLQLCFPEVFTLVGHQANQQSQKVFQEMVNYFTKPEKNRYLLIKQIDSKKICEKLLKLKRLQVNFQASYGCAVILRKQEEFDPIEVYIVFPTEWDFGNLLKESKPIYIPCLPNSHAYIEIGKYESFQASLAQEKIRFNYYLMSLIESQQTIRQKVLGEKDKKNHHTPTWLLQIAKQTLAKINEGVNLQAELKELKNKKKDQLEVIYSKGGTLDMGLHTGISKPNTTFQIVKSLFWFVLQDDQFLELIFLQYRLLTFLDSIKNKKQPRIEVKDYFKCFNQLILSIKQLTNKEIEFKEEVKTNVISKVYLDLRKLVPKNHIASFNKKLLHESSNNIQKKKFQFYEILDYQRKTKTSIVLKGDLGFSSPLHKIKSFKDLLSNKYQEALWIIITQNFFFAIAQRQLVIPKQQLKISIQIDQIVCNSFEFSTMHKVIDRYEQLMKKNENRNIFGMKLRNQTNCHIYLIKYIGAAIAFQVVKGERKKKITNLEQYKIPLPIKQFYKSFYSLNFAARQALNAMLIYVQNRSEDEDIFVLNGSNNTFYKYALKVSEQTACIRQWVQSQIKKQQEKVKKLLETFIDYEQRYTKILSENQIYKNNACSCSWQYDYRKRYQKVTCQRCKELEAKSNRKQSIQNEKTKQIVCSYPYNQTQFYGFLHNIPNDILGLMKITYQSQINKNSSSTFKQDKNFFSHHFSQLIPYVNHVPVKDFGLLSNYSKQPSNFIKYPLVHTVFLYRGHSTKLQIEAQLLKPEALSFFKQNYQYMIDSPNAQKCRRQHQTYSKLYLKLKKEDINEYISYGSVRVSPILQLPYLLQKINLRQILFNTLIDTTVTSEPYRQKYAKMLILLNTIADINAFEFLGQNDSFQSHQIVHQSIQAFLNSFGYKWRFEDMYSLHIIGITFSLLSTLLSKHQRAVQLAAMALEEYEKFANQKKSADNQVKSQFAYFLHGAMAFYCQNITKSFDKKSIHNWTKIQLYFRINKVFSDQNLKNQKYRNTVLSYQHFRLKGIFQNIENVRDYFEKYPNQLTQVVKQIDADISVNSHWKLETSKGYYVFSGQSGQSVYDLNLFTGILLKNGVEIAGLPQLIKKDPNYITIFGQNRDLEVYTYPDGSIRTRSDFSQFFPNQKHQIIMFQFLITGEKQIQIRHIMKPKIGNQKEQKYTFIPKVNLSKSNILIPIIYKEQYFAWFCSQENVIAFRSKQLTKMGQLALLYLTSKSQNNQKIIQVSQGRIIQKEHLKNQISYLRSKQRSKDFDLLKIFNFQNNILAQTSKNYIFNEGFKILSAIQDPKYIIQISSHIHQNQSERIISKFWLHRFNLKFTVIEQGLLSDNFQSYMVRQNYNHHQLFPWLGPNKVNCLVLQKKDDEIKFSKQNLHTVLIPFTKVQIYGDETNPIPTGETTQMQIFTYQLHDHFKDLRSKTKLSQLYLANLIAACYNPSFQQLMMDNQEYSINLLRSCLIPSPLNEQQNQTLQEIFEHSLRLNQTTLALICQVIYKLSKINSTLSFPQIMPKQAQKEKKKSAFILKRDEIQNCKSRYRKLHNEQQISKRKQLKEQQLKLLSLNSWESINPSFCKRKKSKWQMQNQLRIQITSSSKRCLQNSVKWLQDFNNSKIDLVPTKVNSEDYVQNSQGTINLKGKCVMSNQQKNQIENSIKSYLKCKGKQNNIRLENNQILEMIKLLEKRQAEGLLLKKDLSKAIKISQIDNCSSYDYLNSKYKMITQRDITQVLCQKDGIKAFYPDLKEQQVLQFKQFLITWLKLAVATDSIHRIILILKNQSYLDKVGLLKQLQSPRNKIEKNLSWLCFEVELKTQIWLSQYQTFQLLRDNKSGSITQLNMGQGKTQVIIPMIVLDEIYTKKEKIPRVNILSPLFQQAQNNYFKFLAVTGFKVHLIPIYFNRTVKMTSESLYALQYSIDTFQKKCLILIDRDSSLSLILKTREEQIFKQNKVVISSLQKLKNKNCNYKDLCIFRNLNILDVFDEVDALMTCVKSFVYAVGNSRSLPDARIRHRCCRILLEITLKQMLQYLVQKNFVVIEQSLSQAKKGIRQGRYAKGLRFIKNLGQQKSLDFRYRLVELFFDDKYFAPEFQFYKQLTKKQQHILKEYMINSEIDEASIKKIQNIPGTVYNQIYIVRGILAYGVLEHCLSLRNGVQFGVPGKQNTKRVGVPYEAADVPSKRSEYSHPQVATLLSYISYYNKGLTMQQFEAALRSLLSLSRSAQNKSYELWRNCIEQSQLKNLQVYQPKQINLESETQKRQLYEVFKKCRATIAYWLIQCVFITDLNQYPFYMTASSWDLADSKHSLGFSGTKDTHFLLPTYLTLVQSPNDEINGTDGKMISLIIQNTLRISKIKDSEEELWKRFCQTSLELGTTCIIDAGAILAGKSLQNEIIPWLSRHELFKKTKKLGISYCNQTGHWKVLDASSQTIIDRDTSIPEEETFVIFDQARTRGADIKLKTDAIASLSLGPNMTKDKMMQAVGRLRKFGRNQKIVILSTEQNFSKIHQCSQDENKEEQMTTRKIIEWTCTNAINENKKWLYPNSKLAWIHFGSKERNKKSLIQQFKPELDEMYKTKIALQNVAVLNKQIMNEVNPKQSYQVISSFCQKVTKYGSQFTVRCQDLDNVCERQIQMVQQNQKECQKEFQRLIPLPQDDSIQKYNSQLSTLNFQFSEKLEFSSNFINCTEINHNSIAKDEKNNNQLCQINFVYVKGSKMIIVSQREATLKLMEKIKSFGPVNINSDVKEQQFIARFSDLSLETPFIRQRGLQSALTDAQFFNGNENFQDKQLLLQTIKNNIKLVHQKDLQKLVCHFLIRRKTLEEKYQSSNIEDVYKRLINSKI